MRAFAGNEDVRFFDVNLHEAPSFRGPPHNPGVGGWPTIRYYNDETGLDGGNYVKKTSQAMCDELGPRESFIFEYIEEYGGTSLCNVIDGSNCDPKSLQYLEKMKLKDMDEWTVQLERLKTMMDIPMSDELVAWVKKRFKILSDLIESETPEEL